MTAHRDLLLFGNFYVQTLLCGYFRSLSVWGLPRRPLLILTGFSKWPPSSSTFPPVLAVSRSKGCTDDVVSRDWEGSFLGILSASPLSC